MKKQVPDSSQAAHLCIKNGIKVYPVYINYKWYIHANINGFIKEFDKPIHQDEINYAMSSTYIFYANKLK